jgi:hypothetical protein
MSGLLSVASDSRPGHPGRFLADDTVRLPERAKIRFKIVWVEGLDSFGPGFGPFACGLLTKSAQSRPERRPRGPETSGIRTGRQRALHVTLITIR